MADVIRIKRRAGGGAAGAPVSLANAELAYNETDHILYIGEGTGGAGGSATVIVPIGGTGQVGTATPAALAAAAAVGSAAKWSREDHVHPAIAPTVTPGTDSSTKIATTAFVQSAISAVSSGVTNITVSNGLSGGGTGVVNIGITANGIANASLGQMAPHTYKGNNTGGASSPIDVTAAQLLTDIGAAPLNNPSFTGTVTVPTPANPTDAATKGYVDSSAQGLDTKASVKAATTANITLSGTQTVDGVALVATDRCLVKDQSTAANNGIYVVAAGAWTRATDTDIWNELVSAYTFVEEGTVNADTGWICTVNQGGTLGTTAVTWTQFSGAGQVTAGAGLTKTGNTLDVIGTTNRITVAADSIDIAASYVGQTSITTLGTITAGTWNGTVVNPQWGGTGAASLTGYVKGNGISVMTASATIPNTDITGLGTMATQNASAVAITGGTIDGVTLDGGTF
jgi:hypothetical protein